MTGTQTLVAILGVAAMIGGVWGWAAWLEAQSREKQLDIAARARDQETERLRIISDAIKVSYQGKEEGASDGTLH